MAALAHPLPPVGGVGGRALHADDARLSGQTEAGDGAVAGQLQHVAPLDLAVDVVRVDPQPGEHVRRLALPPHTHGRMGVRWSGRHG